jgi:putative addiction module component (TIGR02574 family)
VDLNGVLQEVDGWPLEDQVQLVNQLWDRIESQGYETELTEMQKAELDRRLAAHEADPQAGSTWEEVKARLWGES